MPEVFEKMGKLIEKYSLLKPAQEDILALAGVAQWIECQPVNQRVASSIPSQGKCLGCWAGPQ